MAARNTVRGGNLTNNLLPGFREHSSPGMVIRAICLAGAMLVLVACAPTEQRRSVGTVIDDQTIETQVISAIFSNPDFSDDDHIKIEVHNGTVLLAGETQSESNKIKSTEIGSKVKGVKRVVNELAVMPRADTGDRFSNSYMTSKVNTVLTKENPVEGFDATRIKVLTARRNVYLMGTVTRKEGDDVAEVVRHVGGVEKVIKVFDYTD